MKKKVSTVIDENLFRRTKLEALRQDVQISDVIGEALEAYLAEKGSPRAPGGAVARSWGAIPLSKDEVVAILADEEAYPETT